MFLSICMVKTAISYLTGWYFQRYTFSPVVQSKCRCTIWNRNIFFSPFFITEVLLNSLFAIINFTICLLLLRTRNMTSASEYIWFQSVHLTCCQGTVFWSSYLAIKKRKKEKSRSRTVTDTEVTTSIQIFWLWPTFATSATKTWSLRISASSSVTFSKMPFRKWR